MNRNIPIQYLVLSLILMMHTLNVQSQNIDKLVNSYLEQNPENQQQIEAELITAEAKKLIGVLEKHQNDSLPEVRTEVYRLAYKCGMNAEDTEQRQAVVSFLIENIQKETGGLTGRLANYLADFRLDDFNAESKYKIGQLARKEIPYRHRIIKLSGFLQLNENIYNYKKEIGEGQLSFKIKWAMNLAMARMNDPDALQYIMRKIKSLPVSDNVVYDLLPDLVYVRQARAFDYLFEIIQSDEKNCRSANPSRESKMICAYRLLAMVAPYIDDFPLKQDASGGLDTNNYDQALITAREWIKAKAGNYTLITQTY